MSERILRKTTTHELIERTFTTQPKPKPHTTINISRKGSIVKERCRQLTKMALTLYPDRKIDRDDLAYLITSSIGGDRATVRAYMGYNGYVKHSHTGTLSVVIGKKRKGYLETFGYMHKANLNTWVIHAQTTLSAEAEQNICRANLINSVEKFADICPQDIPPASPPVLNNERVKDFGSKEKISLSHPPVLGVNTERLSDYRGRGDSEWETINVINNNNSERERNFTPMISPKIQRIQPNGIHNRIQTEVLEHLDNLTANVRTEKLEHCANFKKVT